MNSLNFTKDLSCASPVNHRDGVINVKNSAPNNDEICIKLGYNCFPNPAFSFVSLIFSWYGGITTFFL